MKKVLILTVTAGNGHNSAAFAVEEECKKNGAEVLVVDLLHEFCDSKRFVWIQEKGYPLVCRYLNKTYNMFFRHYQRANPDKFYKSPVQKDLFRMYDKLLKFIYEYKPDAIFSSHYFPAIMITNLRKLFPLSAKTFAFVFDYSVCPFWEAATGIDYLLVPNENYFDIMISKGFKKEQLLPFGLTVNERFSEKIDKKEARIQLGLNQNKFTIFVMFGGGFWSGNFKIVKNIVKNLKSKDVQIVVANGKDVKGKKKIDSLQVPSNIDIHNLGFCKNVDLIMSASDVLVGKAGGVSVTEALNKHLPMICCKKLPEQERVNVEMLVKEGAGLQYKNDKMLIKYLAGLIENSQKLYSLKENVDRIRKPFATRNLVNFMLEVNAVYESFEIDFSNVNQKIKKILKNQAIKK